MGIGVSKECKDYCVAHQSNFGKVKCGRKDDSHGFDDNCIYACQECKATDCQSLDFFGSNIEWTCPEIELPVHVQIILGVFGVIGTIILLCICCHLACKARAQKKLRARRWGTPGVVPPQFPFMAGVGMGQMQTYPSTTAGMMPQVMSSVGGTTPSQSQML